MKKKNPPGYPGDEVVTEADEALRKLLLQKGLSLEGPMPRTEKPKIFASDGSASFGHRGEATAGKEKDVPGAIEPPFRIVCALYGNC